MDPFLPNQPLCVCNEDAKLTPYGECVDCFGDADCKINSQTCSKQECICKDGLVMGDDKLCKPGPLQGCKHNKDCDSRAKCIKGLCVCGGSSTGNGKFCRNSKPCSADRCGKNSKCVIDPLIPDEPHCVCSGGFRKTENGECVEMLDCFGENGQNCTGGQICEKFEDGSKCICRDGYEMIFSGGISKCQDANECSKPDSCQPNSECVNSEGSYECECVDGYKKNNGVCQDEDECSEIEGICNAGAECVNFEGSYSCSCKKGYFKKDDECLKDECEVDCKENEECYGGEFRCRKSYRKNMEGYCVAFSLMAGSAQISAYLSTFIFGALGGLALSA